ncbi:MAG: hypothetical protein ACC660_08230, partial [Acidimicrobiales bacterium]
MDQPPSAPVDPVFWWWEQDGGAQVLLLMPETLVLSGPLYGEQVAGLETARRAGNLLAADFGDGAMWVKPGSIREMRYVHNERKLLLLGDGGT